MTSHASSCATTHKIYTSSSWEDQRLSTKKLKGGVSSISLVPHGEGMNLRERPRVKLRRQLTKCKVPVSSSIDENSVAGQGET